MAASIGQAANPHDAFAGAWTTLEARIKCLKLELVEWSSARDAALAGSCRQLLNASDDTRVAIATAPL
jgi:hypothetical protein